MTLPWRTMLEALGMDQIFAQMIVAIGLALVLGNGFAVFKHRRGERPEGVEGELRTGRVVFLIVVGLVMTIWGIATITT